MTFVISHDSTFINMDDDFGSGLETKQLQLLYGVTLDMKGLSINYSKNLI